MILERLAEYGFVINDAKSQLFRSEVLFLGYLVSATGIKIDAKKMHDVVTFSTPSNIAELRKFLGVTGFLRKFISNYSIHAAPLYDLLKKKSNFDWTSTCEEKFNKIKELVQTAEMLSHPNFTKPFIVGVDASEAAIGFYLAQIQNGEIRYVTFGGRTLTDLYIYWRPFNSALRVV